ncbi:MAG: RloB family protein, partial [Nitrospirota bacterium]|nr:RloB family protein [Nitrospirota bacterium]
MANDQQYKKRKARSQKELRRQKAKRAPYDRVLIVCEGSKTEPNYLRDLRDCLKLVSTNIEIDGDCGSSPMSVYNHAERRYREEKKKPDPYDRIFCVFDKDTHGEQYQKATTNILSYKPAKVFKAITSIPCF